MTVSYCAIFLGRGGWLWVVMSPCGWFVGGSGCEHGLVSPVLQFTMIDSILLQPRGVFRTLPSI